MQKPCFLAKRTLRCIQPSKTGCCRAIFDDSMQRNTLLFQRFCFLFLELSPGPNKKPEPQSLARGASRVGLGPAMPGPWEILAQKASRRACWKVSRKPSRNASRILRTVYCALYTVYCSVYCVVYTVYCIAHTVSWCVVRSTVLHSAVLCCATWYCTILYCAATYIAKGNDRPQPLNSQ